MSVPKIDFLVVPGGSGVESARREKAIIEFVRSSASLASYVVAVSSGSLLLGEAGLLRNQDVCSLPDLREQLEEYEVGLNLAVPELRNSSGIWCAATAEASFNLCLELVSKLVGPGLSVRTAHLLGRVNDG